MGKNAKLKKQRKAILDKAKRAAANDPKFDLNLNFKQAQKIADYWLTHPDTLHWIRSQWSLLIGDRPFIDQPQQDFIATQLLKSISNNFVHCAEDIGEEISLQNPPLDIAISLDPYDWTLWTGIRNRSIDECYMLEEKDRFCIRKIHFD